MPKLSLPCRYSPGRPERSRPDKPLRCETLGKQIKAVARGKHGGPGESYQALLDLSGAPYFIRFRGAARGGAHELRITTARPLVLGGPLHRED